MNSLLMRTGDEFHASTVEPDVLKGQPQGQFMVIKTRVPIGFILMPGSSHAELRRLKDHHIGSQLRTISEELLG